MSGFNLLNCPIINPLLLLVLLSISLLLYYLPLLLYFLYFLPEKIRDDTHKCL